MNHPPQIPPSDDRAFVIANLEAYLAGTLAGDDLQRFEQAMAECPETRRYVETGQRFDSAVRGSVAAEVACPQGLRDKIIAALDQCETDMAPTRFPWGIAGLAAAAALMLSVGLVFMFSGGEDPAAPPPDLHARLTPVVSNTTLDVPKSTRCRYRAAVEEYRKHFPDGPDLPRTFGASNCRVSDYHCDMVDGYPVMCTVFDSPENDRFALLIFRKRCLHGAVPEAVRAAEVEIDGKLVLMWREGDFMRALVAKTGDTTLHQRMEQLRTAVQK
ncbi:MAG: hypothetical protein KF696_15470 [Planctomycetes bacterium]|nr:hypothetical protein [Planctomycetota bacterium]MCW8136625.1 hypothetical protein [Planctomycetota bacterium]